MSAPKPSLWRRILHRLLRQGGAERRRPINRSIRRLRNSFNRNMSNTGQGNRNNSLRTEKNIRRRTIDTAPYFEMQKKRQVSEGAECLTGLGFNVDDDEVNRRAGHVAINHAGRVLV